MEEIFLQIGNWGFPMVVAIILLLRIEKKLDELTSAIHNLGQVVSKLY